MADRNFIIEILLKARDDTARAFAAATGQMEAYDRLLDEQKAKTEAARVSQGRYAKELEGSTTTLQRYKRALSEIGIEHSRNEEQTLKTLSNYAKLEAATRRVVDAQLKGKQGTAEYAVALAKLRTAQDEYRVTIEEVEGLSTQAAVHQSQQIQKAIEEQHRLARTVDQVGKDRVATERETARTVDALNRETERSRSESMRRLAQQDAQDAKDRAARRRQEAQDIAAEQRTVEQRQREFERITGRAYAPAQTLARTDVSQTQEIRATRELASARQLLIQRGFQAEEVDRALHNIRQEALHDYGFQNQAARDATRIARDEAEAHRMVESAIRRASSARRSSGGGARPPIDPLSTVKLDDGGRGGFGIFSDFQKGLKDLDTNVSGFDQNIRNSFGFAAVTLIQPLATMIVGLVGAFAALASAAIAAGAALGTTFLSAIVQGIPALGLFAAAMQRLTAVFGYVQQLFAAQQQRFIAQYQTAYQNALGINQVTIAEHNYSDALYAVGVAQRNVGIAQLALSAARQQATRQLQDLILQEEQARLAAEASSLAVIQAQKSLLSTVATGGDVQQAQLQLQQAHVGHVQATVQAQRAVTDAARGSISRQQINEQVVQARQAVDQARRAVVDAQFAAAQARAAIIEAQQAATGFNVSTAAQLAYLRSQMSATERALATNIQRIFGLFHGAHSEIRHFTDQILGAFVPITNRIYQILRDPRMIGALSNLAGQIGNAFRTIFHTLLSNQALQGFIRLINASAANMAPFARIVSDFFKSIGAIAQAAIPFVHQLLGFVAGAADRFASWASSTRGQNWLANFFKVAFQSLEAFMRLGGAVIRLFAAVIGVGGGARTGIGLLDDLTRHINNVTRSITTHGREFKVLHELWASARPVLRDLGEVLGALGHGFLQLGATRQGQAGLKGLADLLAHVLIPALVQFASNLGKIAAGITHFLSRHPALEAFLKSFIAWAATLAVVHKGIGLIFGPLSGIVGVIKTIAEVLPEVDIAEALGPALPIIAVGAAIVGIAAATGNLKNLLNTVIAPFVAIWGQIKKPLEDLGKQFLYFINSILGPFGVRLKSMHALFAGILQVVKFFGVQIALFIIQPIKAVIQALSGIFEILGGLFSLNGHKIVEGLGKIGSGFITWFKHLLGPLPNIVSNLIPKIGHAAERLGEKAWQGIKDGIHAIIHFGADLLHWISEGLGALWKFLVNLGGQIIRRIWDGIKGIAHLITGLGGTVWHWISGGFSSIWHDIESLGENIVKAIVRGIKKFPHLLVDAIKSLIPAPLRSVLHGVAHFFSGAASSVGQFFSGLQEGGPVGFGYGGGDRHPTLLESGEHVFTKEEVRAAGGHGAMFALRRMLGGGGQGGPYRYATGGAIDQQLSGALQSISAPNTRQATQGVTGTLGDVLKNVLLFIKNFQNDWKAMWQNIRDDTKNAVNDQKNLLQGLADNLTNIWQQINKQAKGQLQQLFNNFKNVLGNLDQDIFNAFWYIQHAANQSLKAFNAKPVNVTLGALPKLSGGGFLGAMGEKGRDAVPALLGRGEAVLNWAHQKVVEPAMRAYYGFGLDKMFKRVRTAHAGAEEGGYAAGGYVWPFGGPVNWERTDQGVDFSMAPGTPIGPIGKAKVIGIKQNWYKGQPFVWWELLDGPDKGRYGYVSEQITNIAPPGSVLGPNQAVARFASSGTGIEYGFATASGQTLAQATTGYHEGQVTPAGAAMRALLTALSLGKRVSILGGLGGIGGLGPAAIKLVKDIHLKGSGILKELGQSAIEKVRKAANSFLQTHAGGVGGVPGGLSGPVPSQIAQAGRKLGFNKTAIAGLIGNAFQESGLDPNLNVGAGRGLFSWDPTTNAAQAARVKLGDVGQQIWLVAQTIGRAGINAMNAQKSPAAAAIWFEQNFERAGIPMMQNRINAAIQAYAKGFAKGGFAGDARSIIAHVGEWVINQAQQSKLANWLGTTVGGLRGALGFSGGPESFQGGGEVGTTHTTHQRGTTDTTYRFRGINVRISLDAGSVNKEGVYKPPTIAIDSGPFYQAALSVYSRAQRATVDSINRSVRANSKKLNDAVAQFLKNYNLVGGDNGIFALAAQAIADFTTQQQSVTQLAAAGYRLIREKLVQGVAQTAVESARADLNSTNQIVTQLEALHRQELTALREIDREIRDLGRNAAKTHPQQYQQLIGARNDVIAKLRDVDSTLAQSISDRYTKAAALFQAEVDQSLRVSTLRLGTAQMFQNIAQALGQTGLLAGADRAIIASYQDQVTQLQRLYREASAKAAKDPRWQTIADQLAGQLQEAISNLVSAQAQALQDAISAEDTQAQLRQTATDMANRLADVQAALGDQLGAAAKKITVSQQNAQNLQSQLGVYQGLFTQAQAQGNVQAMNDLTQKIDDLTAQIAEANLQTQQLITAYRELSISILQTQQQATSGFFSAANSISQTLGAIAGNQNLVALISYAKEAAQALLAQAQQIVANINATMNDPNQPFGQFQAQANTFLAQLVTAFQTGPQQFADALAQLAPQLATFEALLPPDEQTLFQNLIQAMIDNTTSTVDNTQQLQQLNATSLQQQFQSSAWQMFREAIFNGLGGLLPQYALAVPAMDVGGYITNSGLLYGHTGEEIVPANVTKGQSSRSGANIEHMDLHFTQPTEVADPVYLGQAIAWRLAHDPNTR